MDIGSRIRILRKEAKLTQEELAKKAFISRSYLADVERNRYNPSLDTLDKIIAALNISKSEFYNDNIIAEEPVPYENNLSEENELLLQKIRSLSKEDAKKILDIIEIFEKENNK